MRSLIHVRPRRKRPPRAAYRPVEADFEPVIAAGTWRMGWHPVGPHGEMRFVAIDEDGHWLPVQPWKPLRPWLRG
jgi:hypothetical protein